MRHQCRYRGSSLIVKRIKSGKYEVKMSECEPFATIHWPGYLRMLTPGEHDELYIKALEAWDVAVEDYEPTNEELAIEAELQRFCDASI